MTKTWVLPAVLCAGQLALWPGAAIGSAPAVAVTATVVLVAAALGLRRTRPVVAVVVVAAGLTLATWVVPAGQQAFVPGDALLVISVADLVALFSVAARRSARTTALVLAALVVWQAALTVWEDGLTGDTPFDLVTMIGMYGMVAAFGRIRGRWTSQRAAAARRLADAERARRDAADAERRRLARELHDVTAHHLTSIVVNASAARMLQDTRPELSAQALEFAARTGHDTLAALRRLVTIMPLAAEDDALPGLADLADDFRQLGQVMTVDVPAVDLPPPLAAAVHGIAREALTNTLRYAPGGTVRLRLSQTGEHIELVVDDDGPGWTATEVATGLGGGRGLSGMRDRAAALGGALTAGPRQGRGWRVRAVFPPPGGPHRRAGSRPAGGSHHRAGLRWLRAGLRSQAVLDAGLVFLAVMLPLTGLAVGVDEDGLSRAVATLILLALLAHAVPLLWRRSRPWWVLGAVTVTAWLAPLLSVTTAIPAAGGWPFLFGGGAELAAVYAVAAWGSRPRLTWLAPVAAVVSTAPALAVLVVVGTADDPQGPGADAGTADGAATMMVQFAVTALLFGGFLAVPAAASWLAGWVARRRRSRRRAREEGGVAVAMAQAALRARDERARIAAGLRDAVLHHTAAVPRAAENADLDAVLGSARQALAAMRGLLDGLGRGAAAPEEEVTPSGSA
ncbi:histidine kinase [Krasilnikovia sp. MM14-A1259]|uniref:sensor histidine kinase n=1 Tax=Krasilnikovia sp. MM14-A1259 TaxID=3373539 RepID=UPI0037F41201